jgi:hypothetical protein
MHFLLTGCYLMESWLLSSYKLSLLLSLLFQSSNFPFIAASLSLILVLFLSISFSYKFILYRRSGYLLSSSDGYSLFLISSFPWFLSLFYQLHYFLSFSWWQLTYEHFFLIFIPCFVSYVTQGSVFSSVFVRTLGYSFSFTFTFYLLSLPFSRFIPFLDIFSSGC